MSKVSLDLISNLHVANVEEFDWDWKQTSPSCLVLGNVADDYLTTIEVLTYLSTKYHHVFYIDGSAEHMDNISSIQAGYSYLQVKLKKIKNLTYLQNNVVIINGTAILATNGWRSFNDAPLLSRFDIMKSFADENNLELADANTIYQMALADADYIIDAIKRLQTHAEVSEIIVCTHSVPLRELLDKGTTKLALNSFLSESLSHDTENKIRCWLFGNYSGKVDTEIDGIRYVSNGMSDYRHYYPVRIELNL